MQLKPEILAVLNTLGADQNELDNLTAYFSDQLVNARSTVEQIDNNISSLQTQRAEAQARVDALTVAIGKFVVDDANG